MGDHPSGDYRERVEGDLERASELYAVAHGHDDVGRFGAALGAYRAVLATLGDAPTDGNCSTRADALRVRTLLGLARCGYEANGDLGAAMRLLDDAEELSRRRGLATELIAVQGQRGLLLLRSGDFARAREELDRAEPRLDREPSRDAAVLLLNRGALHLDAGVVAAAEADLEAAAAHAAAIGDRSVEGKALHNLGYAHFVRGDLPLALRRMSESEEVFSGLAPHPVGLLDRSRVLYEAGLVREAVEALEAAAALLEGDGAAVDLAHVRVDTARCLLQLRRHDAALRAARAAREAFVAWSNTQWALRAELVELEAELGILVRDDRVAECARVHRRAGEIAEQSTGLAPGLVAVPARVLQAEAAVLAGDVDVARAALAAAGAQTDGVALSVRIQREVVAARLAFGEGDRRRGLAAVRRGQALLSDHRAHLGSVDAVTAAALHGVRLAIVDVEAALGTGRASAVFDAVERGRATFAGTGRVRPPADPRIAELLERARREVEASVAEQSLEAREAHVAEARRLQEAARRRAWQDGGSQGAPLPATAGRVREALRTTPDVTVASLALVGGVLHAVAIDAAGERLVRLGPWDPVAEQVHRVRADLGVLANGLIPELLRSTAAASVARALGRLDETLLGPLGVTGDLHVAARDLLLTVPWSSLPSRRGRRTWANAWVDLRVGERPRRSDRALVVAGPGLLAADEEASLVAAVWDDAVLLRGADASCAATAGRLAHAGVVHLAAHGTHEPDNPLFSSVRLADGPLFAHELDGTDLAGAVVVLSACEVGRSTSRVGGEPLGLTSVLLRHGASAVIAAVAPLRDDVAVRVMPALHTALRDGLRPGRALARAVADEPEPVPLVCFGPLFL
jgi:tetratricopeptide (TPR) repeat protein